MTHTEKKSVLVHRMFDNLAQKYDRMNNIITCGLLNHIKKRAIGNIPIKHDAKILDICTGTGDIALFIAKHFAKDADITGVDFSQNMLDIAVKKAENLKNIKFMRADALNLPFEDDSFDISIISFGLRNLENLRKGLMEMKRVTRQGGYIVNLDLGKPKGLVNKVFRLYFFNFVPLLGRLFYRKSGDNPYRYLPESSDTFPSQEELVKIFKELGFSEVRNYNFICGAIAQQIGIVNIIR